MQGENEEALQGLFVSLLLCCGYGSAGTRKRCDAHARDVIASISSVHC